MCIFLLPVSFFILVHLLCLSLPTTASAAVGGSGLDTSPQPNEGNFVGSDGTSPPVQDSWAPFLNPSHIIGNIQSVTKIFLGSGPSSSDFWEMAKEYEQSLQDHVPRLLSEMGSFFNSTNFTDIASTMHRIVNVTATFRADIEDTLQTHNITFDVLTKELEDIFAGIMNDLENIPPPDTAPGHQERAKLVDKILDDTALALTKLLTRYGIKNEIVMTYLSSLRPHVQMLILTVSDANEQYPYLFIFLVFCIILLLIPELWILRPLLNIFGFGPLGPVKASAAAWLQSYFWGPAVAAKSWFSVLQAAGMGVYPSWAWLVVKVPMLGGLLALFLASFKWRR